MGLFRRTKKRIVVVKVEGIIADNESLGAGRAKVTAALKEAVQRKARAVVLRVNSPGGSIGACQEIFDSITRIREKGIPVVSSMGDVAASGGFYISMAANEIVANPGTVTGSIGVIIRSSDLSHLYERVGVSPKVVKSGPHKDMLATYRSFSKAEESLLQDVIDDSHRQFVEVIATSRGKTPEEITQIADGRIFTGRQALKMGLVDYLGDLEQGIKRAASLAGIDGEPSLVYIQPKKGFFQRMLGPFGGLGQRAAVSETLGGVPLWILPTL